jgi:hypothetical protein
MSIQFLNTKTTVIRLAVSLAVLVVALIGATWTAKATPVMPVLDGGTVWLGEGAIFQRWDDGSWVYVWRARPGEPPPETRWPDRAPGSRNILAFAGREWTGGYLAESRESQTGDRVLVAQDGQGEWYVALYVPGAVFETRAPLIVQALQEMKLGSEGEGENE